MRIHRLTLRTRIFLFFLLLILAAPVTVGIAIVLATSTEGAQVQHLLTVYTGTAAVISAMLAVLVWQLFDRHVAHALQALAREIQTAVHTDHELPLDTDALRHLGPVGPAAADMLRKLQALRQTSMQGDDDAHRRLRQQEQRFAAIVRDLDVGILVVSLDHRILLYNQCALQVLGMPDELGLSRSVFEFLAPDPLGDAVDYLQGQCAAGNREVRRRMTLPLRLSEHTEDLHQLALSAAPVCNDSGTMDGYVLMIERPDRPGAEPAADTVQLPPRPEFYDFDLFARAAADNQADAALSALDYVVFDTETTGLEPSNGDEIISIAAVRIVNGRILRGEVFDALIDPGKPIPAASIRFHGISDEQVHGQPDILAVLPRFARYVGSSVLVAHNAAFDMKFLTLKQGACGVELANPVLDTVLLSAWLHDHATDHTLDALAERFGITVTDRHTALGDALATAEVFRCMLPLLAARDVTTLGAAITISDAADAIKRAQRKY